MYQERYKVIGLYHGDSKGYIHGGIKENLFSLVYQVGYIFLGCNCSGYQKVQGIYRDL